MDYSIITNANNKLDDEWEYVVDNEFALSLARSLGVTDLSDILQVKVSSQLCKDCRLFRDEVYQPSFSMTYRTPELEYRATSKLCDLCVLLWKACKRYKGRSFPTAQFDKIGSFITMNGRGDPVLSIVRSTGKRISLISLYSSYLSSAATSELNATKRTDFKVLMHYFHSLSHKRCACLLVVAKKTREKPQGSSTFVLLFMSYKWRFTVSS